MGEVHGHPFGCKVPTSKEQTNKWPPELGSKRIAVVRIGESYVSIVWCVALKYLYLVVGVGVGVGVGVAVGTGVGVAVAAGSGVGVGVGVEPVGTGVGNAVTAG